MTDRYRKIEITFLKCFKKFGFKTISNDKYAMTFESKDGWVVRLSADRYEFNYTLRIFPPGEYNNMENPLGRNLGISSLMKSKGIDHPHTTKKILKFIEAEKNTIFEDNSLYKKENIKKMNKKLIDAAEKEQSK